MKASHFALAVTGANFVLLFGLAVTRAQAEDPVQPVVRAQRFELVDTAGKLRGELAAAPGGEVTFRLFDATGAIRTEFGASRDGSGVAFMDSDTYPGVRIYAGDDAATHRNATTIALQVAHGKQNLIKP
jgi:hypothetical protein